MTTHTDPRTTTYSEFAILIPCRTDDPDRILIGYHDSTTKLVTSLLVSRRGATPFRRMSSSAQSVWHPVHFTLPTHPITSPSLLGVHQAVTGSLCLQSSGDGPGPGPAHGCTARRRPTHPTPHDSITPPTARRSHLTPFTPHAAHGTPARHSSHATGRGIHQAFDC
jgi:hypothetical protein